MKSEKTTPAASIFEKQYLTVSEIRSYLNVSMTTAYELVHRKDFPVAYFGSNIRIPTGPFLAWVESAPIYRTTSTSTCASVAGRRSPMPGKRRSNGEGSIRKLPSGLWYCQYMDGYKPNGKRNLRHLSAPTRSELLVKLREAQNNKEDEPAPSPVAFDAWVQQWLDAYREQVQPSTYCNYRYTAALLTRYFTDR